MNHKAIPLILVLLAQCACLRAQTAEPDSTLNELVQAVVRLREPTDAATKQATEYFVDHAKVWTTMNEMFDTNAECDPRTGQTVPGFGLNKILNRIETERTVGAEKQVRGDFLNGEDPDYNYSLYEHKLLAGRTATYKARGRVGRQTFVIVPYHIDDNGLSATLIVNEQSYAFSPTGDRLTLHADTPTLSDNDEFTLMVENGSTEPQAFVLLNHNTRQ